MRGPDSSATAVSAPVSDPVVHRGLQRARSLAVLLDSSVSIPGTGRKIGLDPLLGIVPGLGDLIGAALSGYIIFAAGRSGVPAFTLFRMLVNVGIDTLAGSVPILGDAFDAAWKSNLMNVALFEKFVAGNGARVIPARAISRVALTLLLLVSLALLASLIFLGVLAYLIISRAVFGH